MPQLSCGICLKSTESEGRRQCSLDEDAGDTLLFKLRSIGFFKTAERNQLPAHFCTECTIHIEDAYTLKLKCLKASQAYEEEQDQIFLPEKDFDIMDLSPLDAGSVDGSTTVSSPSFPTKDIPGLIKILPNELSTGTATSIVLASAQDMFTCIRDLSSTLKLNKSLLSDAVKFLENSLSLLTVLTTFREETPPMKKSAQAIKKESELWKMKSGIMHDASSFVQEVSCTSFLSGKGPSKSLQKTPPETVFHTCATPLSSPSMEIGSNVEFTSESSTRSVTTQEREPSSDSPSVIAPYPEEGVSKSQENLDSQKDGEILPVDNSHFVRRSSRTRSSVDQLVYWPSFKKHKSPAARLKSSKKLSDSDLSSTDALDSLLLKREAFSDFENSNDSPKEEKWSIVRKRKAISRPKSKGAKRKLIFQLDSSSTSDSGVSDLASSASSEATFDEAGGDNEDKKDDIEEDLKVLAADENYVCNICGKSLTSLRNLHAHTQMHTGTSPYQCTYCSKIFTSSWNRVQHERVHTGEKPYVCDICQEPFRYNVTRRHHKAKHHANQRQAS